MFLRHEGFLGALGAFMSYEKHGLDDLMVHQLVERFPMGAPYIGGRIHGPPLGDLNEKASIHTEFEKCDPLLPLFLKLMGLCWMPFCDGSFSCLQIHFVYKETGFRVRSPNWLTKKKISGTIF